jgi:hypothetical protein
VGDKDASKSAPKPKRASRSKAKAEEWDSAGIT